jgi:FAD:protein FMN transferase
MTASRSPGRLTHRREFIAVGIGAFVVAAVPISARFRRRTVRRMLPVMGTIAEITVIADDYRGGEHAIDAAFAELTGVERTMSRFLPASDVGRANALAFHQPVAVSGPTRDVLDAALRWAHASDGAFDPAIGRVVELWDVNHRREPPPDAPVRRLAARHLFHGVELGMEKGKPAVAFRSPDIHLDLGGIAKGYGVDRASDALRALGVRDALINVGGDLVAMGMAPDDAPWHVGIQSPVDPDELLGVLDVSDRAVATSGDYVQFFRFRGVRYHHLMDPATARPRQTSEHSVTVEAETCMNADAAATAVFGMSATDARALLASRMPGARLASTG